VGRGDGGVLPAYSAGTRCAIPAARIDRARTFHTDTRIASLRHSHSQGHADLRGDFARSYTRVIWFELVEGATVCLAAFDASRARALCIRPEDRQHRPGAGRPRRLRVV